MTASRTVEMPEEDRTVKWRDTAGDVWVPLYSKTWWGRDKRRYRFGAYHELYEWHELLCHGPLTEAGPA